MNRIDFVITVLTNGKLLDTRHDLVVGKDDGRIEGTYHGIGLEDDGVILHLVIVGIDKRTQLTALLRILGKATAIPKIIRNFAAKSENMKKIFVFLFVAMTTFACQESLEQKAAREAELYTRKNCPAQMTDNIIIDSMTFEVATHTLHYHYRLTGVADSVGALSIDDVKATLLKDLRNTTSMKAYKDAGYNFAYTYRSEKNPKTVLYDVTLTTDDYQ